MKPHRVQFSRRKGFVLPPNTIYVGRPTQWGNHFKVDESLGKTRAWAVSAYRSWLEHRLSDIWEIQRELRGKNLACWCPLDQPCHADVLLEIANAP